MTQRYRWMNIVKQSCPMLETSGKDVTTDGMVLHITGKKQSN
jgi:hypothetical protein